MIIVFIWLQLWTCGFYLKTHICVVKVEWCCWREGYLHVSQINCTCCKDSCLTHFHWRTSFTYTITKTKCLTLNWSICPFNLYDYILPCHRKVWKESWHSGQTFSVSLDTSLRCAWDLTHWIYVVKFLQDFVMYVNSFSLQWSGTFSLHHVWFLFYVCLQRLEPPTWTNGAQEHRLLVKYKTFRGFWWITPYQLHNPSIYWRSSGFFCVSFLCLG